MGSISFTVPGTPQGKARPRVVRSASGGSHIYTPDKTVAYEELVRLKCREACSCPLTGPLSAEIEAIFPIPKSTSKKARQLMEYGQVRPTKKPDADNIAKIILDAINGIAYEDDAHVVRLSVVKDYECPNAGVVPGVRVTICET